MVQHVDFGILSDPPYAEGGHALSFLNRLSDKAEIGRHSVLGLEFHHPAWRGMGTNYGYSGDQRLLKVGTENRLAARGFLIIPADVILHFACTTL